MKHARRAATPGTGPTVAMKKKAGGSGKHFRLEVRVAAELADEVSALLVAVGAGGVEEQSTPRTARLLTYGREPSALERLATVVRETLEGAGVPVRTRVTEAKPRDAWETAWMRHLEPVQVSPSLTLVPTTSEAAAPGAGRVVRLVPAMAFGFGEHATTRMAAREVERLVRAGKARRVLDVGTGSGVLAIVAAVCGAERAVGIDVDEVAVKAAVANAVLNDAGARCRFSTTPAGRVRGTFDLVVANVGLRTLLELAPAIARRAAPGGTVLLTGIISEHASELASPYLALGLRPSRRSGAPPRTRAAFAEDHGWAMLSFVKPRPRAEPA